MNRPPPPVKGPTKRGAPPPPKVVKRLPIRPTLDQEQQNQQNTQHQTKQTKQNVTQNSNNEIKIQNNQNKINSNFNKKIETQETNIVNNVQTKQQIVLSQQNIGKSFEINQDKQSYEDANIQNAAGYNLTKAQPKNQLSDEFQIQGATQQKVIATSQISRTPPPVPIKRPTNIPGKAGGFKKPTNAPKPPPIIKSKIQIQQQQISNQITTSNKQNETNQENNKNQNLNKSINEIKQQPRIENQLFQNKDLLKNREQNKEQNSIQKIDLNTKAPSISVPPPIKKPTPKVGIPPNNLTKQLNKTSPTKRLTDPQLQQEQTPKPLQIYNQPAPPPPSPATQKTQSQIQIMSQSAHLTSKQVQLKALFSPTNSQLAPKFASLKNKAKELSIRKQQLLKDSSQSDSEVQSQTYSEMDKNKKNILKDKNLHIHSSAQSAKPIKSQIYDLYSNNQSPQLNTQKIKIQQSFNPFNDQTLNKSEHSITITKNKQIKMFKQQKQQKQTINEAIVNQQKQEDLNINDLAKRTLSQPFSQQINNEQINKLKQSKSHIIQNTFLFNKQSKQNQMKEDKLSIQNDQIQNQVQVQQKQLQKDTKNKYKPDSKTIVQQKESSQNIDIYDGNQKQQKTQTLLPPLQQKLLDNASNSNSIHPRNNSQSHPPPPKQSLIHPNHNNPINIPKIQKITTHLQSSLSQNSTKQNTFADMSRLLTEFAHRKQQYLKNAQQLSEICSRNRQQEGKKISTINQLLVQLQQQNIKLKTILSSY